MRLRFNNSILTATRLLRISVPFVLFVFHIYVCVCSHVCVIKTLEQREKGEK